MEPPAVYRPNALKQKLAAGRKVLGCWSMIGNPVVTEILGLAAARRSR
jgi:2-keto-3-deoxy-L-rhamnonate aldolase RhmA